VAVAVASGRGTERSAIVNVVASHPYRSDIFDLPLTSADFASTINQATSSKYTHMQLGV
jgi:hypothetical protein